MGSIAREVTPQREGRGAIDRRVAQRGADRRGGAGAGVGVVRHTHAATIAVRGTGVESSFGCPAARPCAEMPDGGTHATR